MIYRLELTAEDIEVIGSALDEMPFKRVYKVAAKIQAQINAQNAAEKDTTADAPQMSLVG